MKFKHLDILRRESTGDLYIIFDDLRDGDNACGWAQLCCPSSTYGSAIAGDKSLDYMLPVWFSEQVYSVVGNLNDMGSIIKERLDEST